MLALPRRAIRQPQPHLVPGGDCGACVLGGLLDLDIADVYGRYGRDGAINTFVWYDMRRAIQLAYAHRLVDRVVVDVPLWPQTDARLAWGLPGSIQCVAWWNYLEMAITAGYYGLAIVDHAQRGVDGPGPDRWVLLCGVRERRPPPREGGAIHQELLISNSNAGAPAEEWVERQTFLRQWGGFNVLLARPTQA